VSKEGKTEEKPPFERKDRMQLLHFITSANAAFVEDPSSETNTTLLALAFGLVWLIRSLKQAAKGWHCTCAAYAMYFIFPIPLRSYPAISESCSRAWVEPSQVRSLVIGSFCAR